MTALLKNGRCYPANRQNQILPILILSVVALALWNGLPEEIRKASTFLGFLQTVKNRTIHRVSRSLLAMGGGTHEEKENSLGLVTTQDVISQQQHLGNVGGQKLW